MDSRLPQRHNTQYALDFGRQLSIPQVSLMREDTNSADRQELLDRPGLMRHTGANVFCYKRQTTLRGLKCPMHDQEEIIQLRLAAAWKAGRANCACCPRNCSQVGLDSTFSCGQRRVSYMDSDSVTPFQNLSSVSRSTALNF